MRRTIERINRHVPPAVRHNAVTGKILSELYRVIIPGDDQFQEQMSKALEMYEDKSVDRKALYNDMLSEFVTAWIRPVEYAKFELFHKSPEERRAYIPDHEEVTIFKRTEGSNILPDSKFERYLMFRKYFRRDVLCVDEQRSVSEEEYKKFIAGKETVVVKPLKGTKGHGVAMVSAKEIPGLSEFGNRFPGACLVEEMIMQGEELKKFHPESVNTVRFVTGMDHSGGFHNLFSLVRIGQGDSIIDNVAGGGLVALVDMEKGRICSSACRGTERFEYHPDTNVRIEGTEIPQWEELCSLVREIHFSQPGQRIFGFDMAWTTSGWDLVEINPAPSFDSYQELTGKGIRPYLQRTGIL